MPSEIACRDSLIRNPALSAKYMTLPWPLLSRTATASEFFISWRIENVPGFRAPPEAVNSFKKVSAFATTFFDSSSVATDLGPAPGSTVMVTLPVPGPG